MRYISTRGQAPALDFEGVLLAGLAADGGLYVPESWPALSVDDLRALRGLDYVETAFRVTWPFVEGAIAADDYRRILAESYATFDHAAVTPLVQIGPDLWTLELFHGPTLAFKDVAWAGCSTTCWPGAARASRSSARPRATPAPPRSRPAATATTSASASCTRKAARRRRSAAR